jgi:hypothetical protein
VVQESEADQVTDFHVAEPGPDACWRSTILFGINTASYKFALAHTLLELAPSQPDAVRLEDLALPYARRICAHLAQADRQATSPSSRFLAACRSFNHGETTEDQLCAATVRLGFNNVIDAFHVVNGADVPVRFFVDERRTGTGIRPTNELYRMTDQMGCADLERETEARWRLVETAWELALPRYAVAVEYEQPSGLLFVRRGRRVNVTICRDALNGYQRGRCFHCGGSLSLSPGNAELADVDHLFPWSLTAFGSMPAPVDGVWNLVLACRDCNRGADGKFARAPAEISVGRLHRRNEYLIGSHHPLRETLMAQTGRTEAERRSLLRRCRQFARDSLIQEWQAPALRGPLP